MNFIKAFSLFLSSGICWLFSSIPDSAPSMMTNEWNIQLSQASLNCGTEQACYTLALQSASGNDWTLGDQNYRFFFDGDFMTVTTVTSLLPNSIYSTVSIDQNIKITGQGQEPFSPLDDIDDNLGFLDFSITQTNKSNPIAAIQIITTAFTPIAEICIDIESTVLNDLTGTNCISFYHSRPFTAGSITNQYTTISENDVPNNTVATIGSNYEDLISTNTTAACPGYTCACQAAAQILSN